jgi:hypothetical protein
MATYQILTVEQFIKRHEAVCASLTEQEARIVAKTAIFAAIEYNTAPAKAEAYLKNINDVQRAAMRKFFDVFKKTNPVTDLEILAFDRFIG